MEQLSFRSCLATGWEHPQSVKAEHGEMGSRPRFNHRPNENVCQRSTGPYVWILYASSSQGRREGQLHDLQRQPGKHWRSMLWRNNLMLQFIDRRFTPFMWTRHYTGMGSIQWIRPHYSTIHSYRHWSQTRMAFGKCTGLLWPRQLSKRRNEAGTGTNRQETHGEGIR